MKERKEIDEHVYLFFVGGRALHKANNSKSAKCFAEAWGNDIIVTIKFGKSIVEREYAGVIWDLEPLNNIEVIRGIQDLYDSDISSKMIIDKCIEHDLEMVLTRNMCSRDFSIIPQQPDNSILSTTKNLVVAEISASQMEKLIAK